MRKYIYLLESNGGHLYVGNHESGYWDVTSLTAASFEELARAIEDGDTSGWTLDHYQSHEVEAEGVADYLAGTVSLYDVPIGTAARLFLNLSPT